MIIIYFLKNTSLCITAFRKKGGFYVLFLLHLDLIEGDKKIFKNYPLQKGQKMIEKLMDKIPSIAGFNLEAFLNFAIDPNRTEEIFKVQQALLPLPNRAQMVQWTHKALTENGPF